MATAIAPLRLPIAPSRLNWLRPSRPPVIVALDRDEVDAVLGQAEAVPLFPVPGFIGDDELQRAIRPEFVETFE